MKKIVLIIFALFIGLNVFGQGRRDRMGNPVVNREPTDKEIADHKRKIEERKNEFIANFITTLEGDDFQKEIVKQYINSYFDEKVALSKIKFEHTLDRDKAIKKLDDSHFAELEELISEDDMTKIKDMIKGDFDEKEVKKEKKKKRKKRKKKNKDQ
ncbi:hypothetical protein [Winogradskyella sp. PG-2]|uniref:hypothetical protein n=1 Tax=Winogradskyella sp. PG-2 TaxID=754409 RepID=UPI0004585F56|nr:hypothetical protein [Winogradskyella sp. PG-2]BAO77191.1 hypothetical protein WPG_2961 [Winogradskyella sp. PG-2]